MKKVIKAAVFESAGKLAIKEIAKPVLKDTAFTKRNGGKLIFSKENLVLLKILKVGICGTDIGILNIPQGYPAKPGTILGHEFTGKVLETGRKVERVKVGDIAVADEHIWCGDCVECRMGHFNRCEEIASMGMSTDGGFTQYVVIPAKQIYKVPKNLNLNRAVLFEPLYCTVHAVNRLNLRPNHKVLILGAGPLGHCFVQVLLIHGIERKNINVLEVDSFRKMCIETIWGIKVINPQIQDLTREVPLRLDAVIDACGNPKVIKLAIGLLRPYGKLSLFGQQNDQSKITLSLVPANRLELEWYGSDAASPFCADQTINYLGRKDFRLHEIITHELSLGETLTGIELMRQKKAIKVIINPWKEIKNETSF